MPLFLENIVIRRQAAALFDPLTLTVGAGEIATVMGPSGCGKSTLLAAVCGTLDPGFEVSGRIVLDGALLNGIAVEDRKVGILFQDDLLFPHLDVFGNLAFGLPASMSRPEKHDRVRGTLAAAGMTGFERRDVATLSGGQKARVSLLRALLAEPRAILLDEPFSRLDRTLRGAMREFVFSQVASLDIPALLVTHDHADAPDGSRIIELAGERVVPSHA